MVPSSPSPRDVIVGELRREYRLSADQEWTLDQPGGVALYTAAGYLVWERELPPGICARVGEDYPQIWLEQFTERGLDTSGVVILPRHLELRSCIIQEGSSARQTDHPLPHLTKAGVSLPTELMGLPRRQMGAGDRRTRAETAIWEADIPDEYLSATGVHFCPLDYPSHNLLPAVFRQRGYTTVTLEPGDFYMDPSFLGDIPALVTGLTAFLPAEEDLRNLYKGISADLWEMAAELGHYGCEFVVITRRVGGEYLYENATDRRWEIGHYPSRLENSFGARNAFSGGFLAGFRETFDPLEAACRASVSASLAVEGSGAFYPLNALPGLAEARLEVVREMVREV